VNRIRYWFAKYVLKQDVTFESVEPAVKETKIEIEGLSPVYTTQ
jgi:hypothetical protein